MTIVVTPNVIQTLLRYYKELRNNPKYKISFERAWEKYSNFHKYLHGGIIKDLPKGRFCKYTDMGQKYNQMHQPKFPFLMYLMYVDESKFKWYVAYVYNESKDKLTITRIKGASNVQNESMDKNKIVIKERQLRQIIREAIKMIIA